jgi:hypothetical protein
MKSNRFLVIVVALAAWLTSLCLLTGPSHACCQPGRHTVQKELPACCVVQPATQVQPDQTGFNGPLPDLALSSLPFDYLALLGLQPGLGQSRMALAFVPDQSNRYLELRVLLN